MRNVEQPASVNRKGVPHLLLGLAGLQCGLALVALVLDLVEGCGACARITDTHTLIAAAGVVAYLALLILGLAGRMTAFTRGIYVALGIHAALMLWMFLGEGLCGLCVVSAVVALIFTFLAADERRSLFLEMVCVTGGFILGMGIASVAVSQEAERKTEEARTIEKLHQDRPFAPDLESKSAPIRITVFEMEACGFCQEFRDFFSPRIERDFGSRVEISYRAARETTWVRWTPTIVVEGQDPIQGLPRSYGDLSLAIQKSLRERNHR